MKLIIASNNKGKIREYKELLEPLGYETVSQSEAGGNLDAEETGGFITAPNFRLMRRKPERLLLRTPQ